MTDLIAREQQKHNELLEKIEKHKKRKRTATLVSSLAASFVSLPFFIDDTLSFVDVLTGSTLAFLAYQIGTSGSPWLKNPLSLVHPKHMLDNLRTFRGSRKGKRAVEYSYIKRHGPRFEGTIDGLIYDAQIAMHEKQDDVAENLATELLCAAPSLSLRQNILVRTINRLLLRRYKPSSDSFVERILDANYFARHDNSEQAERFLNLAVASAIDNRERTTALCVYGNYLEASERKDEAKTFFQKAAAGLDFATNVFVEIPGSRNKVYVHHSRVIGGSFVFKTGDEEDAIRKEYEKTAFIHSTVTSSHVVVPLALVEAHGRVFSVTRRAGTFSLQDYIDNDYTEASFALADKSLESILLLHLKSGSTLEEARRILGSAGVYDLIERKIFTKVQDADEGYAPLRDGLDFLCREVGDWEGITHMDFHPRNIIIDKYQSTCVIDLEKAKCSLPYFDAVMLVDNYRSRRIFDTQHTREKLAQRYYENVHDSGAVASLEDAARDYHIAGVLQNIFLYHGAQSFSNTDEVQKVKIHHVKRCKAHIDTLQGFYFGEPVRKLEAFKRALENVL